MTSNPLVAPRQDSTQEFSGVPLLESVNDTTAAIASGDWASGVIGAAGTALDAVGMAMDPFGAILSAGVGWLIEHVGPLSDALDALTGDPDQIKAHAQTWQNVATELGEIGTDLSNAVDMDTAGWTGDAGDAYRARSTDTANLLAALRSAADGVSGGITTAGEVVGAVRTLVRDIIAELVGHLISWALQVLFTAGIGLLWVVPQVARAVASTAARIAGITTKLVRALGKLGPMLKKLGGSFGDAGAALKKIKASSDSGPRPAPAPRTRGSDVDNDSSSASNWTMPTGSGGGPSAGGAGSGGPTPHTTPTPPPAQPHPPAPPSSTPPAGSGGQPNAPHPANTTPAAANTSPSNHPPSNHPPTNPPPSNQPPTNPPPVQLTGNNPATNQPMTFRPDQVQSIPLRDSNGNVIGVSYPTKPTDATKVPAWAGKPNRTSDASYIPDYNNTPGGGKPAPWSGQTPFYAHAHANPNHFAVNVNTAAPGQPPNYVKVHIDGTNHGNLLQSNSHFQNASGANPHRPVVYMSCGSGNPAGNAAASSANVVHGGGHSGDIFAPSGSGVRITGKNNNSYYGVKPPATGGPGEFNKF